MEENASFDLNHPAAVMTSGEAIGHASATLEQCSSSFSVTFPQTSEFAALTSPPVTIWSPTVEMPGSAWAIKIAHRDKLDPDTGCNCDVWLVNMSGVSLVTIVYFRFFDHVVSDSRLVDWTVDHAVLLKPSGFSVSQKLQEGPLTVRFRVDQYVHSELHCCRRGLETYACPTAAIDLSQSLQALLVDTASHDVALICIADACSSKRRKEEPVTAHKLILSMRTPVFKTMFQAGMKEAMTNEVTITDIERPVLQALVQFLYTNTCDSSILDQNALQLLAAAAKYQVSLLQRMCASHIAARMTTDNVLEALQLAELYQSGHLKVSALQLIARNAKCLLDRENFMDSLQDGLWREVLRAVVTHPEG